MKISVRKYAVQELRLQMITVSQSEVTILGRYYRKSKHRYFIIPLHNAEEAPPLKGMSEEEIEAHILGVVMIEHYSMKKSIDLFSNQAKTAVTKELTKINNINTYEPKHAHKLTFRRVRMLYLCYYLIIEKRDSTIKAILVGDGSKQKLYDRYDKSKGSLPTCVTNNEFLNGVIDARERQVIAMLDIKNAFLHA